MRVTEDLIRQNRMKNQQRTRMQNEEEEPTMRYKEEKREYWAVNGNKSVFDSPMDEGINTGKSVFNRKAVFRT